MRTLTSITTLLVALTFVPGCDSEPAPKPDKTTVLAGPQTPTASQSRNRTISVVAGEDAIVVTGGHALRLPGPGVLQYTVTEFGMAQPNRIDAVWSVGGEGTSVRGIFSNVEGVAALPGQ